VLIKSDTLLIIQDQKEITLKMLTRIQFLIWLQEMEYYL